MQEELEYLREKVKKQDRELSRLRAILMGTPDKGKPVHEEEARTEAGGQETTAYNVDFIRCVLQGSCIPPSQRYLYRPDIIRI